MQYFIAHIAEAGPQGDPERKKKERPAKAAPETG